jgi:hypothetical protein
MQRRWTDQNVDLDSLSDSIEDFFKSKNYLPTKTGTTRERIISWLPGRTGMHIKKPICVRITGEPDDFTVDLEASELMSSSIRTGVLTKPFGGGYFLLKALKLKEWLERLENEFWIYVEERVAQLARSA